MRGGNVISISRFTVSSNSIRGSAFIFFFAIMIVSKVKLDDLIEEWQLSNIPLQQSPSASQN